MTSARTELTHAILGLPARYALVLAMNKISPVCNWKSLHEERMQAVDVRMVEFE
jgi:hypothetical protein